MADPKWDDTEDIEMKVPTFEETEEYEAPSMLESGLRAIGQGVTLGFLDEIMAAFGTKGASPSMIVAEPEKAMQIERQMMRDYDTNLEAERAANKLAQEANPMTYGALEIVGGIVPGLLSGGGAAAANVVKAGATQGVRQAAKTAAVEGGKLGLGYGAASGAGYSEAETPLELATDTAIGAGIGGAAGAALPLGIEGGKKVLASTLNTLGKGVSKLPGGELAGAAYKFGRQGKGISTEQLDDDLARVATEVYDNIKVKKKANDLIKVKEQLDDLGFKVNTKETVQDTIEKLRQLKKKDFLDENNKEILDKLETFSGIDKERQKMIENLSKKLIKKQQQSSNKIEQSVISGEKKLAKQAFEKGDSLETITDTIKQMDDLELPLTTKDGRLSGVTGKFKDAEGNEFSKQILKDTPEYQPQVSEVNLEGRTVFNTKDLGTGKIDTMVSSIKDKMSADLENMSIQDVDYLRDALDKIVRAGDFKDPNIRAAADLSKTLKNLSDEVVEKLGSSDLIQKRQTFSDIFAAEDLLGIRKNIGGPGKLGDQAKITQLMNKLTQKGNVKQRRELELAKNLLGEDVVTPQAKEQLDMINKLIPNTKVDADGNVSRTGLFKQVIGKGPNLVGQAVTKVATPVSNVANKINKISSEQLMTFAGKLSSSSSEGAQMLGMRLTEAMSKEGPMQSQAIWALSQSPAFREMIKRYSKESDNNLNQMGQQVMEQLTPEQESDLGSEVENSVMKREQVVNEVLGNEIFDKAVQSESAGGKFRDNRANKADEPSVGSLQYIESTAKGFLDNNPEYKELFEGKEFSSDEFFNTWNKLEDSDPEFLNKTKSYLKETNLDPVLGEFEIEPEQMQSFASLSVQLGPKLLKNAITKAGSSDINSVTNELITNIDKYFKTYISKGGNPEPLIKRFKDMQIEQAMTVPEMSEVLDENPDDMVPEISNEEVESVIDRVNQQQSSGEATPMNQLDQLLGMINKLKLPEETIDELEEDATNMVGYNDGQLLKEKIKRLQGL